MNNKPSITSHKTNQNKNNNKDNNNNKKIDKLPDYLYKQ